MTMDIAKLALWEHFRATPPGSAIRIITKPWNDAENAVLFEPQDSKPHPKPDGLWYGIGCGWDTFVLEAMPEYHGTFSYRLRLDYRRILCLRTVDATRAFDAKYGTSMWPPGHDLYDPNEHEGVRWAEVAKRYDGIEIAPYQITLRRNKTVDWYYPWDVASGCIWRPRALLDYEPFDIAPVCTGQDAD